MTSIQSWQVLSDWFHASEVQKCKGDPSLISVALEAAANSLPIFHASDHDLTSHEQGIIDGQQGCRDHLMMIAKELRGE